MSGERERGGEERVEGKKREGEMGGEKEEGRREERGEERISQGSCPAISGPWPRLPWCLLTRKTLAILVQARGGVTHMVL